MAAKHVLSAMVLLAFGTSQIGAAESKDSYRLAQAERGSAAMESGIFPGKAKIAAAENFSNAGPAATLSDKAMVTDIRFLTTGTYTRVMMELSQAVRYESHNLPADASKNLPPRIYVDIFGARLAMNSKESILIDDGLLRQVRVGQFSQDVVRVVLDMNSVRDHNAFLLPDPYRLVIDIQGQAPAKVLAPAEKNKSIPVVTAKEKPSPTVGIRKIVLDPGHGGKDPGAIGVGGIAEKDIVLSVAKKLAKKLQKEMGIDVVLTRKDDRFIPLEDRTAIANAENSDLFLSLHMNASPNADARGIETYYLDKTTDEAAMRLAARENSTSRKNVSDLQFILSDMTQSIKLEDSISLAYRLQSSMVSSLTTKMGEVSDLGVKKALFYVLVGARMPSVLVEMFFITNKSEGRAMSQENYQDAMVEALYEGIQRYAQTTIAAKTL
jgi:N-acetylmuramoyl-L-alanine amidase